MIEYMILLQGNNIARTFGADILFENINFTIQDNSRVFPLWVAMALVNRRY